MVVGQATIAGPAVLAMEVVLLIRTVPQATVADLAIAVDCQQIAHLEQQPSLMEHVWKQDLHSLARVRVLHILTLLQAMEAGQATIVGLLLATVADLAIAADYQQIAHLEQQPSLMVHVWKADRHLIAMPIQAHQ